MLVARAIIGWKAPAMARAAETALGDGQHQRLT